MLNFNIRQSLSWTKSHLGTAATGEESVHRRCYPYYNAAAHSPANRMVHAMTFSRIPLTLITAIIVLGTPGTVLAQTDTDAIAAIRAQIGANRKALVAENLQPTAAESDAFWPLYREFHNQRDTLMDRRVALLKEFGENFETLTDEKSKQIMNDYFKFEEDMLKLDMKYAKKFSKVLSDKRTLRYFQIENKLDTIINSELAQVVPLAE